MSSYIPISQRVPPRAAKPTASRNRVLGYTAAGLALVLVVLGIYFFVFKVPDPRLTGSCGIAVDGSGSSANFKTEDYIDKYLDGFLYDTGCREVDFAPIDTASASSNCNQPVIDIDEDEFHDGSHDVPAERKAQRAAAVQAAHDIYACIQAEPTPHYSDVLGGISRVVNERPLPTGKFTVLVISDFGQSTKDWGVYGSNKKLILTEDGRQSLIAKVKNDSLIPNLTGIDVRSAALGADFSDDPQAEQALKDFWNELILTDAHAKSFQQFGNS